MNYKIIQVDDIQTGLELLASESRWTRVIIRHFSDVYRAMESLKSEIHEL